MKKLICILIGHKWHVDHMYDVARTIPLRVLLCERCGHVKATL